MSSKKGYNNVGFIDKLEKYDRRRDTLNNRHEIAGYQAINETFLDDNGEEYYYDEVEPYVDFINQQQSTSTVGHCGPGCRRSIACPVNAATAGTTTSVIIEQAGCGQPYRRYLPIDGNQQYSSSRSSSLCVGYHRVDSSRPSQQQQQQQPTSSASTIRHRYESISSDDRYEATGRMPTASSTVAAKHEYETIDALHRRYEEIEAANEEYVDYPEDRMGYRKKDATHLPIRESPLGSSGTIKHIEPSTTVSTTTAAGGRMNITPVTTPKKNVQIITAISATTPPQRGSASSSTTVSPKDTPKRKLLTRRNTIILAPMLANIERQQQQQFQQNAIVSSAAAVSLQRSKSTIITTPRRLRLIRDDNDEYVTTPATALVQPNIRISPDKSSIYAQYNSVLGKSMQNLSTVAPIRYHTPLKLQSFNHIMEADIMDPTIERSSRIHHNRKPNTAIITPNMRSSIAVPLLSPSATNSPSRHLERSPPPPVKTPSTFSKASWATLPTIHLPTEMLCCVGFLLLTAGAATAILCFYLLAVAGRKYFLNFGAVAGFSSLVLGMFSCRTNKWKWLPHRNYMTGYVLLTTFSILNSACLGGIVYALEDKSYALLDTLGGAVCGISVVLIIGSILGMVTSGCCHRPPPDNRVAHGVSGFTV